MSLYIKQICQKASLPAAALAGLMMTACYAAPDYEMNCNNGIDDDNDGLTDLEDDDCSDFDDSSVDHNEDASTNTSDQDADINDSSVEPDDDSSSDQSDQKAMKS